MCLLGSCIRHRRCSSLAVWGRVPKDFQTLGTCTSDALDAFLSNAILSILSQLPRERCCCCCCYCGCVHPASSVASSKQPASSVPHGELPGSRCTRRQSVPP